MSLLCVLKLKSLKSKNLFTLLFLSHHLFFILTSKVFKVFSVTILPSCLNVDLLTFYSTHIYSACHVLVLKSVGCVYVTPTLLCSLIYILLFFAVSCYHLLLQRPDFLSWVVKVSCCLILQGQQDLTYSTERAAVYHAAYSLHAARFRLCAFKQHDIGCSCGYRGKCSAVTNRA